MTTTRRTTTSALTLLCVSMLLAGAGGVAAQGAADGSDDSAWLPYVGCWVEVEGEVEDPMICVVPEPGGAALLTVTPSGVTDRQSLRADGVERLVSAGGCEGEESVERSTDAGRLYLRSRLSCDGGTERVTRGLIAMVGHDQWVRIRAMTVGAGSVAWVERFRPAPASRVEEAAIDELDAAEAGLDLAIQSARMAAAAPITVDDIIEAHARTEPEAVRAWIAERATPIRLDADRLVRLADAGVRDDVIDVAIAVSYPERFAVAHQLQDDDRRMDGRYGRGMRGYGYDPYYYDPFYYGYNRYGYSTLGWGGYYGGGYYGSPTVVVVQSVNTSSRSRTTAVNGRGYTRSGSGGSVSRATRPSSSGTPSRASGSGSSSGESKGRAKPKPGGGGG